MMYHVQFVMSVRVLQSTWFLLSTHALQLARMDQRVLWILDDWIYILEVTIIILSTLAWIMHLDQQLDLQ